MIDGGPARSLSNKNAGKRESEQLAKQRKLIIGCGYLGLRVARLWLSHGDEVFALTRSAQTARTFEDAGIRAIVGDVMRRDTLIFPPQIDVMLYAVGLDRRSGHSQRAVYVDGLENVLKRSAGALGRLIYVSSVSVYGQTQGEEVDEGAPSLPTRENGQVCLQAEELVWRNFRQSQKPNAAGDSQLPQAAEPGANVLRLAGIYGPGRLLSRVETLRAGAALSGNPDAFLNLIHVDDAAAAVNACERLAQPGATYLVCDDAPMRRREYFERLAQLIGAPAPQFEVSGFGPEDAESRNLNKRCRNRRLKEELQMRLTYPTIKEGLPQALGDLCVSH